MKLLFLAHLCTKCWFWVCDRNLLINPRGHCYNKSAKLKKHFLDIEVSCITFWSNYSLYKATVLRWALQSYYYRFVYWIHRLYFNSALKQKYFVDCTRHLLKKFMQYLLLPQCFLLNSLIILLFTDFSFFKTFAK